uniref:Replicase n=1 Tax=Campylobacter hyointestinalis TaxID=198 RepID=Q46088_CAMHY|nr:replicase [Campylobacter hyointestinalis]
MKKTEIKNIANRQIMAQSNKVITAKYELTEAEQKIILLAIAQVDSIKDKKFGTYKITIPELEQKIGSKIKQAQLKETCRRLMQRVVYIENGKNWKMFHWISTAEYIDGENTIKFKISDEMKPFLLQLKGNFTKIELENALKFNGKYTLRFYQFCMQMQNQATKKRTFELSKLYEILQLPESLTTSFARFKLKVIEPSINEINTKSDIKANWEISKKIGKKIVEIELNFKSKERLQEQTKQAREVKSLKKYIGKQCLYFDYLIIIEQISYNAEQSRYEVIYKDGTGDLCRADFDSIDMLEIAIKKGKIEANFRKANPELFKKIDSKEEIANLFRDMMK